MKRLIAFACLALTLCLPARFAHAVVINFDDVDTSQGAVIGQAVIDYLAGFGITLIAPTNGQAILQGQGNQVPAPSAPNYFGVGGPGTGFTYTFHFAAPINFFSFTTPALGSGSTMAEFRATAYSSSNVQLSQVARGLAGPNVAQATWTLNGPGIDHIEFFSSVQNFAGSNLIFDDVTFTYTSADVGISCTDAKKRGLINHNGNTGDGIYTIDPDANGPTQPFDVYCDMTTNGGGWTLIAWDTITYENDNNNGHTNIDFDHDLHQIGLPSNYHPTRFNPNTYYIGGLRFNLLRSISSQTRVIAANNDDDNDPRTFDMIWDHVFENRYGQDVGIPTRMIVEGDSYYPKQSDNPGRLFGVLGGGGNFFTMGQAIFYQSKPNELGGQHGLTFNNFPTLDWDNRNDASGWSDNPQDNSVIQAAYVVFLRGELNTLNIVPPSGILMTTAGFDLALIIEGSKARITGGTATFNGVNVTAAVAACITATGTLSLPLTGQTLRCPGLTGRTLGVGTHTLTICLDLSDGSHVCATRHWEVLGNTEP